MSLQRELGIQGWMSTDGGTVQKLVEQLKELIIASNLKVGDSLPSERELGERFVAARNTVREAMGVLKAYGVVEVHPKVGAIIVNRHLDAALEVFQFQMSISRETFLDIQGFRKLVEVGSYDLIVGRATPEELLKIGEINESLNRATSPQEAGRIDYEFHSGLLQLAGNKTVLGIFQTMRPIIQKLMESGKSDPIEGIRSSYEPHTQILSALERRDRLGFQYLMSTHLEFGLRFIKGS